MLLQMEDHLVLRVDQLVTSKSIEAPGLSPDASCSRDIATCISVTDGKEGGEYDEAGEDDPLIQSIECRICQEEDSIKNLEVPCACNGSLKFAHRNCVQRWCNEKGDTICEICHKGMKGPRSFRARLVETLGHSFLETTIKEGGDSVAENFVEEFES
ncbi:RING/FYVE/PHD zinc finger superfamily protein [Tanacetum coccineum]